MSDYYGPLSIRPYKSKAGKKGWRGSIDYYVLGKRKQKTCVSYQRLKRDARAELEKWREEQEKIARALPDTGESRGRKRSNGDTVMEVCVAYLNNQLAKGEIEKSTYSTQISNLTNYAAPYIGNILFVDLDRVAIEGWITKMYERGLSQNTIHGAFMNVNKVYKYFAMAGLISHNPLEYVKTPKKGDAKVTYLDKPQFDKLVSVLKNNYEEGDRFRTAVMLATFGGLRRGEICGLRWYDVDFEANSITVSSAIGVYTDENGQTTYTKSPKNLSSARTFPMPAELRKELELRYAKVQEEYGCINGTWFVCGQSINYYAPTTFTREFEKFADAYQIRDHFNKRATLHCLRHNLATVGVKANVDIASLAAMMGHKSKAMTLDTYSSATPDAQALAAKKLESAFDAMIEE